MHLSIGHVSLFVFISYINLDIERNRITAIIGPSGCGKSTFLKSLNMMITEEKGAKTFGDLF